MKIRRCISEATGTINDYSSYQTLPNLSKKKNKRKMNK